MRATNGQTGWPVWRIQEANAICKAVEDVLPAIPNIENLTANGSMFLPALGLMLQKVLPISEATTDEQKKPRLFSLIRTPSLKWHHIHINHKTLSIITSQKYPRNTYREQVEVFHCVFYLYTFGYISVNDIVNDREIKLNCTAQSDGHGITLQFVRRKATSGNTKALLQLDDFNLAEAGEYFHPITVDPGRNEVFTAAVGFNNVNHETRSCSKGERANFAGYTRRSTYLKKLKERKVITSIESSLPSPKVVSKEAYIV
ncbi:hypothetical protein BDF20DRAFT_408436 [Mycotypha africana]|uniref:uncharacterized protein n=1 Tax=Mycotypha africana TaxID=64632 RepID=UPI002300E60D|nr:uncharacterized protein BDF20DRAFT_408436 [Mycotypha africana]KAI8984775.1 hypothetical protein BDF20DRAFT_408436 [Mycotypha africana]